MGIWDEIKAQARGETTPRMAAAQARAGAAADRARDASDLARFGIALTGDQLRSKDPRKFREDPPRPVAGVRAELDITGNITRRMSATRVIGGTLIAPGLGTLVGAVAKKDSDNRSMYLVLIGPGWQESRPVEAKHETAARDLADRITTAGGTLADPRG